MIRSAVLVGLVSVVACSGPAAPSDGTGATTTTTGPEPTDGAMTFLGTVPMPTTVDPLVVAEEAVAMASRPRTRRARTCSPCRAWGRRAEDGPIFIFLDGLGGTFGEATFEISAV